MRALPVIQEEPGEGSLGRDGSRRRPYPADVSGRFTRARRIVFAALIATWAVLPWIHIAGRPAVFLDVMRRQFFLFGLTFNAQDAWLLFFLLTGIGFGLVVTTSVLGRVWCGWACPQTVFLEGMFRPIERFFQGPRNTALRRAQGPMTFDRAWRRIATHASYAVAALFVAHVFLAYFVSIPALWSMVRTSPAAHPEAFAWMAVTTGAFYANFAFFREQLCVVICPYGRLQSVLLDEQSLVVGYDTKRTDCVDCKRCVVVCPTGIDIRQGLQLDCIACTQCIDACDAIMDKLEKPRGLVRYDSLAGLKGEPRRFWRPRLIGYAIVGLIGLVVAIVAIRSRTPFEANLLRQPGIPYTREGDNVRNSFELHLVNKRDVEAKFDIAGTADPNLEFVLPMEHVVLPPLGTARVPVVVTAAHGGDRPFSLRVTADDGVVREAKARMLGAPR